MTLDLRYWGRSRSRQTGPIALGGQRQRALLAVLALSPGRVVATDRLVDLLWARTRRRRHGVTAERVAHPTAPGDRRTRHCARLRPASRLSKSMRSVRACAGGRGGFRPMSAVRSSVRALEMWRGSVLAEFVFRLAQPEIRRLEELRLVAIAERIDADLERATATSSASRRARGRAPVARKLATADDRAVPCGPAGEAQTCIRLPAPALSASRHRARPRAAPATGRDPPPRRGDRRATTTAATDDDVEIVNAIVAGRRAGHRSGRAGDLAARLASTFGVLTTDSSTLPASRNTSRQ